MEVFGNSIIIASAMAFVFGFVNLIKPMEWMHVRKRYIGLFIVLASVAGFCLGLLIIPSTSNSLEDRAGADPDIVKFNEDALWDSYENAIVIEHPSKGAAKPQSYSKKIASMD